MCVFTLTNKESSFHKIVRYIHGIITTNCVHVVLCGQLPFGLGGLIGRPAMIVEWCCFVSCFASAVLIISLSCLYKLMNIVELVVYPPPMVVDDYSFTDAGHFYLHVWQLLILKLVHRYMLLFLDNSCLLKSLVLTGMCTGKVSLVVLKIFREV